MIVSDLIQNMNTFLHRMASCCDAHNGTKTEQPTGSTLPLLFIKMPCAPRNQQARHPLAVCLAGFASVLHSAWAHASVVDTLSPTSRHVPSGYTMRTLRS